MSKPNVSETDDVSPLAMVPESAVEQSEAAVLSVASAQGVEGQNPAGSRLAGDLAPDARAMLVDLVLATDRLEHRTVALPGEPNAVVLDLVILPNADGSAAQIIAKDTTTETTFRDALVESRRRYKDFVDLSTDFTWETGPDGRFTYVSAQGGFGFDADTLLTLEPASLLAGAESDQPSPFRTEASVENEEYWLRSKSGPSACVIISAEPLADESGNWLGARGVCRDVTDARERDAVLAQVRNRERLLTHMVRAFRAEVSNEKNLINASETLSLGLNAQQCVLCRLIDVNEREPSDLPVGPEEDATIFSRESGAWGEAPRDLLETVHDAILEGAGLVEMVQGAWQILAAPTRFAGSINGLICLWRNVERGPWTDEDRLLASDAANQIGIIHEQMRDRDRVVRAARTDTMTGLLNRGAFFDAGARQLRGVQRDPRAVSMLYIDLDNFKAVNDTFGHAAGDDCILALRDVILENTRPADLAARLGGDEFAIWMDGADIEIAKKRADAIQRTFSTAVSKYLIAESPISLSCGITPVRADVDKSIDALIKRADAAMYEAKKSGKGRVVIFDHEAGS